MPYRVDALTRKEFLKYLPHHNGLIRINDEQAILILIAERDNAAAVVVPGFAAADAPHREALGDLVFFKLCEHGQNADHRAAKGR